MNAGACLGHSLQNRSSLACGQLDGTHLYGRGFQGKQFVSRSFCVAVHVNENVDAIRVYHIRCLSITRHARQINKVLSLIGYLK